MLHLDRNQRAFTRLAPKRATVSNDLLFSSLDLVEKFLEIAERKVSVLDDYGYENWEALRWLEFTARQTRFSVTHGDAGPTASGSAR
jgi:hypothetical protein